MEKITADEAAQLVQDGDAILISGSGGGHAVPESLLAAVERRFVDARNAEYGALTEEARALAKTLRGKKLDAEVWELALTGASV